MREIWFKRAVRGLFFQPGSVRKICFGPLRGMIFRTGPITGLSALYSGTERAHQKSFRNVVQSGDVVVDVGANWGLHTLYLSRLVGRNGRVIALEPFPPALDELQWHLQANGCQNVKVLPVALGEADGKALFALGESAYTGGLSATRVDSSPPKTEIQVIVRTLDSVVKELGINRLKLVKIDVEGAEGKVLSGACRVMEQLKPHFVIDLHTPVQDVQVAQMLTQRGYQLKRLNGPPILRTNTGWPDREGVWGSIEGIPPF